MELIEGYFKDISSSKLLAFLESSNPQENDSPQYYEDLAEVVHSADYIPSENLRLKRGVVEQGTNRYLSAEIEVIGSNTQYIFFNRAVDKDRCTQVIAKIVEFDLSPEVLLFVQSDCNNSESSLLKTNQVVVESKLLEAEYIAFFVDGEWYKHKERNNGRELAIPDINTEKELEVIF